MIVLSAFIGLGYFYCINKGQSLIVNEDVKDKIEMISWIFSGIMGIVSFLALFVAFVYENKLGAASKNIRQILYPYGLDLEEYRQKLNEYIVNTAKSPVINIIYLIILVTTVSSIFIWGIAVLIINNFSFVIPDIGDFDSMINNLLYLIWGVLTLLLIGQFFLLDQIRLKKDPLNKGYLPSNEDIFDMDFIKSQNADMDEILKIISPQIDFFKSPNKQSNKNEIRILFPIKFKNIRLVVKFFNGRRIILRIYGCTQEVKFAGNKEFFIIGNDLPDTLYSLLINDELSVEYRYYDLSYNLVSRISANANIQSSQITIIPTNIIPTSEYAKDIDNELINGQSSESFQYQNELIESYIKTDE